MMEGREPFPDRVLGATGGGCVRGAFYSEEHPVTCSSPCTVLVPL